MLKQFVFVIVSFLIKKRDVIIHCARVIMTFVMLIQYTFHNENTLNYMKQVLYRIDNMKIVFVKYKFQNIARNENDEDEIYFNTFKLYIIIHYVIFIRLYDSVQNFDTAYEKTAHKFLLNIFFVMTNRIND